MLEFLLLFLPSFIQVPIRKVLGANIGRGTKIRFGTYLKATDIDLGRHVIIGPFSYVKAKRLNIGDCSRIKPFSISCAHNIEFGKHIIIAPIAVIKGPIIKGSEIKIGDHSYIFPFCWIDPREGVEIGKQTGVGGHTLIFTHGGWMNYLNNGPIEFGKVIIEDNVWIPWRVFILPNVRIGRNSIIRANSLVSKSIPQNCMAAGTPAKVLKSDLIFEIAKEEKIQRVHELIDKFHHYMDLKKESKNRNQIKLNSAEGLKGGDLLLLLDEEELEKNISFLLEKNISVIQLDSLVFKKASNEKYIDDFILFLRKYGIRLSVEL